MTNCLTQILQSHATPLKASTSTNMPRPHARDWRGTSLRPRSCRSNKRPISNRLRNDEGKGTESQMSLRMVAAIPIASVWANTVHTLDCCTALLVAQLMSPTKYCYPACRSRVQAAVVPCHEPTYRSSCTRLKLLSCTFSARLECAF